MRFFQFLCIHCNSNYSILHLNMLLPLRLKYFSVFAFYLNMVALPIVHMIYTVSYKSCHSVISNLNRHTNGCWSESPRFTLHIWVTESNFNYSRSELILYIFRTKLLVQSNSLDNTIFDSMIQTIFGMDIFQRHWSTNQTCRVHSVHEVCLLKYLLRR